MNAVHDDDQRTRDIPDPRTHDSDTHARLDLHANALIAGRYQLLRVIGRGASGVVYEANDQARSGLGVALKLLVTPHPRALARLKNEFRALCETVHPNLVGLHGLGVDPRGWFVVMDLISPHRDLLAHVRTSDAQSYDEALLRSAFIQLARGVRAIHDAGKLHRDLKPSNVLVDAQGRVVVADFGLIAEQHAGSPGNTADGWFVGTPAYAAPEQAQGRAVGPKADLYAVGAMLFEALTGRLPIEATSTTSLLAAKDTPIAPEVLALLDHVPGDLSSLCKALIAREPELRPDAERVLELLGERAPSTQVAPRTLFVGRELELQLLIDGAERAREGAPVVALVSGESGLGKSALLERFADTMQASRGALVLRGRCHAHEHVPYKAFDNLVDELGRHLMRLPPLDAASLMPRDVSLLTKLFPTLSRVGAVEQMPQVPARPEGETMTRARAFAALKELLARIADRRALVLCFDDLQWSDDDSAELLRDLVHGPDAPACLFVCTFRPEADVSARLFGDLSAEACLAMPLHPLSAADALRLTRALVEGQVAEGQLATMVEEASGSPFLLAELAHGAHKFGGLHRIDELVQARIDELDQTGRALLEIVAVAGQPIDTTLALRAAELAPEALAHAVSSTLLRVYAIHDRELIDCSHARIRDAVVDTIPAARRDQHHIRLAHALCGGDADPEQIARHFLSAGEPGEAHAHLIKAAHRASQVLAFARAAELYARALSHAAPHEADALELSLAESLACVGRVTQAASHYERVMARAHDPARRGELASNAMMLYLLAGEREAGTRLLAPLCRELGILPLPRSGVLAALVQLWWIVRYVLATRIVDRPVPNESSHRGTSQRALVLCVRATRGFAHLSLEYSQYFALRALIFTREQRDPRYWPVAMSWDVVARSVQRGTARARDEHDMARALALAEARDDGETLALVWAAEGGRCFATGQLSRSIRALQKSEEVVEARGRSVLTIFNGSRTGRLAAWLMTGELGEIEAHAEPWLADARAVGNTLGEFALRVMSSFRFLARDQPDRMRDAVAALRSPLGDQTMFGADVWWFGEPALYEQDAGAAFAALEACRASRYFRAVERTAAHRVWTRLYTGRASLLAARHGEPAQHHTRARKALYALERERYPAAGAMALHLRAGIALAERDRTLALHELGRAERAYELVEMRLFSATMRFHAGALREGEDGRALAESARSSARALGAHAPERWFHAFLPGFSG